MKHWIIEQTATGVILFDGEAASREDAFERYAQDGDNPMFHGYSFRLVRTWAIEREKW